MSDPMVLTVVTPYSMNGFVFYLVYKSLKSQTKFYIKIEIHQKPTTFLSLLWHFCNSLLNPCDCNLLWNITSERDMFKSYLSNYWKYGNLLSEQK